MAAQSGIGKFFDWLRRCMPVRLVLFFMVLALAYVLASLPISPLLGPWGSAPYLKLGAVLAASALMLGLYALLIRWLEKRPAREIALRPAIALTLAGALLALLLFVAVYAVLWKGGYAAWKGYAGLAFVVPTLAMATVSGVGEELIFRGGVFRLLEDSFGTAAALLVSSLLFGFMHAANPHATLLSSVAIALEAGLLLGAAYCVCRSLWLPIGLHFGWNFTEGGVLGAAVSGFNVKSGMFPMPLTGPDYMTGGAFGPEASLVTFCVCLAAGLILVYAARRRGHWIPAGFRLMLD
jgi:uncharacterized protein